MPTRSGENANPLFTCFIFICAKTKYFFQVAEIVPKIKTEKGVKQEAHQTSQTGSRKLKNKQEVEVTCIHDNTRCLRSHKSSEADAAFGKKTFE